MNNLNLAYLRTCLLLRKTPIVFIIILITTSLFSEAQTVDWAISDGNWTDDNIKCAKYTINNEVVFVGSGHLDETYASDAFIIKLDSTGKELWRIYPTSSLDCTPTDIEIDNNNDIIITGSYRRLELDSITLVSGLHARIFVLKLNSNGELLWLKGFGSSMDTQRSYANALTIDDETNDIYITGKFDLNILFDTITISSLKGSDIFIASLNSDGDPLWAKSYGGKSDDWAYDIEYYNHQLYVAGSFNDYYAMFDTLSLSIVNASINGFLACFNLNGSIKWITTGQTDNWSYSEMQSIAIDNNGYLYTYGQLQGEMVFNMDTISPISNLGGGMLIKYNAEGNIIWGKTFENNTYYFLERYVEGTFGRKSGYLSCDNSNNVFLATSFDDSVLINDTTVYCASRDLINIKYNEIGYPQWVKKTGGNSIEIATNIDINDNKKILTAGYFMSNRIQLGDIILVNYYDSSAADFLLMQMEDTTRNVCPTVQPILHIFSDYICGDDSIVISCEAEFGNTYSLFRNDSLIETSFNNSFKINDAGIYFIIINKDFVCSDTTKSVEVSKYAKPEFTISTLTNTYLCNNDTAILQVSYSPLYSYSWYLSDSLLSTNDTISVTKPGLYTLQIDDDHCSSSDSIIISYNVPNTEITSFKTVLCPNATIDISTVYDQTYTYSWFYNDTLLNFTDNSIKVEYPGSYSVFVMNEYCNNSDTINITSQNFPEVHFSEDTIITSQLPIKISPDNDSSYFYMWNYNDRYLASRDFNLEATQYGNYNVVAVNSCGMAQASIKVLSTTGLNDTQENQWMEIFPNPTVDEITIQNNNKEAFLIEIFNVNGECLITQEAKESLLINLSDYPDGMFIIKVKEGNRNMSKKILKQN